MFWVNWLVQTKLKKLYGKITQPKLKAGQRVRHSGAKFDTNDAWLVQYVEPSIGWLEDGSGKAVLSETWIAKNILGQRIFVSVGYYWKVVE